MAKKPVRLNNGKEWPSRGDAINYFRELRDRQSIGAPISEPSDHDDLLALLERYDFAIGDAPGKIGVGVNHFETRINVTNGGRSVGFWVVRVDGSETDFSFIRAVNEAPKRELEQLSDACREAVFPELQSAKALYFATHADTHGKVSCAFTGNSITVKECALEYLQSGFAQIVKTFADLKGWGVKIPPNILTEPADAQTTTVFASPDCAAAFRQFHRETAQICVVDKANRRSHLMPVSAELPLRLLEL